MDIVNDLDKLIKDVNNDRIDTLKELYEEIIVLRQAYKKQFSLKGVVCSKSKINKTYK
jgi:hypothetical protein